MGTGIGIGASVGSSVAGPVIDVAGYHGGFLCVAAFAVIAALIAVLSLRPLRRALGSAGGSTPSALGGAVSRPE